MQGLTLNGAGFATTATGPKIDSAADWLTLSDVPKPMAGPGQALVRMLKAAVNPSDLHFIKGEYGQPRVQGAVAGFEGCGVVEDGPKALIGKRVSLVVTPDGSGAWGEYAVTQAASCVPLHGAISDVDGAGQMVNPLTAMAMMHMAKDAVVVTAANSQLGKLMLGLAADLNVRVIAVVRSQAGADAIDGLGAAHVLCCDDPDFAAKARSAISALKPRMMLDAVADQAAETLFTLMPTNSRWVVYGKVSTQMPKLTQIGQLIFMGKQIEGFWLSKWFATASLEDQIKAVGEVQRKFATGQWRTDVSHVLPLSRVIDDLAGAVATPNGKVILDIAAE